MEKASPFSTLPPATSMRRRCGRVRRRRVDNALLIHRYGVAANTTLKDEPPCPATAAPTSQARPISSRSICVIAEATYWSAMSICYATRFAPLERGSEVAWKKRVEKASPFSTLPPATSMRRRCGRLRWRRVDNALFIHRYVPPANKTLKDEPHVSIPPRPCAGCYLFLHRQSA